MNKKVILQYYLSANLVRQWTPILSCTVSWPYRRYYCTGLQFKFREKPLNKIFHAASSSNWKAMSVYIPQVKEAIYFYSFSSHIHYCSQSTLINPTAWLESRDKESPQRPIVLECVIVFNFLSLLTLGKKKSWKIKSSLLFVDI